MDDAEKNIIREDLTPADLENVSGGGGYMLKCPACGCGLNAIAKAPKIMSKEVNIIYKDKILFDDAEQLFTCDCGAKFGLVDNSTLVFTK